MKPKSFDLLILFQLSQLLSIVKACGEPYKRVCYYTSWGGVLPDPADLCTHVIFSFAGMEGGVMSGLWSNPLKELRQRNKDVVLMVAVGGWA